MERILYSIILALSLVCAVGCGQDATAASKAQVFEALLSGLRFDGSTLSGGKVYFYSPGTTTAKAVYTTRAKTVEAANPYTLDSNGQATVYGDGVYDIKVTTSGGTQKAYWYNVALQDYTSVATATIDDYASLTAAITAIGATPTRLVINSATTLTGNSTVPNTLELEITQAGSINQGAYTLAFSGVDPVAGYHAIFTGTGAVSGLKVANPFWFGGTTNNATVDNPAIQAAINAADATIIPETTLPFKVGATTITVPANKAVKCLGPKSKLKRDATAAANVLQITGSNSEVSGCTIAGSSEGVDVATVLFDDIAIAISTADGSSTAPLSNIKIIGNYVDGFTDGGILAQYATDVRISGNTVTNCGYRGIMGLSLIDSFIGPGNIIDNIQETDLVQTNWYGISVTRDATKTITESAASTNVEIFSNIIRNVPKWEGIDTHAGVHINIHHNRIYYCKIGINAQYDSTTLANGHNQAVAGLITNNIIEGLGTTDSGIGINVSGESAVAPAFGMIVSDNLITGHGDVNSNYGAINASFTQSSRIVHNTVNGFYYAGLSLKSGNSNLDITQNKIISKIPSQSFYAYLSGNDVSSRVQIEENTFTYFDAANTPNYGIYVNEPASVNTVILHRNRMDIVSGAYLRNATTSNVYSELTFELEQISKKADVTLTAGTASQNFTFSLGRNFSGTEATGTLHAIGAIHTTSNNKVLVKNSAVASISEYEFTAYTTDGTNITNPTTITVTGTVNALIW